MCPTYNRAWSVPIQLVSNLHSNSKLVKCVQNYIVSLTLQGSSLWILEMMRTRHLHQQDPGGLNLMMHAPSIFQHAFSDTLRYCVLLQSKKNQASCSQNKANVTFLPCSIPVKKVEGFEMSISFQSMPPCHQQLERSTAFQALLSLALHNTSMSLLHTCSNWKPVHLHHLSITTPMQEAMRQ